jgi:hypothetical protein
VKVKAQARFHSGNDLGFGMVDENHLCRDQNVFTCKKA